MFDINSIKKLFSYDYKDLFERISPKDNKELMDQKMYEDIVSGAILKIGSSIIGAVATVLLALTIAGLTTELFGGVNYFGISDHISFTNFVPITLPLAILIYVIAMKEKEQSSLLPFVVLVLTAIDTLTSLFRLITWMAAVFINPFSAMFGFSSVVVNVAGNLFVLVGCLDFCLKTKKAYMDAQRVTKKNTGIKTSTIHVEDISLHTNKYCSNCGTKMDSADQFCKNCGHKREL